MKNKGVHEILGAHRELYVELLSDSEVAIRVLGFYRISVELS